MRIGVRDGNFSLDGLLGTELHGSPLDELLRASDVVTLHCPLTPGTRHLLDARRIAMIDILQDDTFARLLTLPNVIVTGHQGFFTDQALRDIATTTLENITLFERGRSLPNQVT